MEKKRSAIYDNMKLFLMACVVLGHLGNRYSDINPVIARAQFWVYLFHMPAFIFIAGMFSKRTIRERRWDKAVPYIMLYLWMRTQSLGYTIIQSGAPGSVDFFSTNGPAWFALAMFWWHAAAILLKDVHPAYVLTASVLIAAASGYSENITSFLIMQRSINFFPIFYLGTLVDPVQLKDFLKKWQVKIASAAVILCSLLITYQYFDGIKHWRYLFRGLKMYSGIKKGLPYEWGWSWRILGYVISLVLTFAILSLMPDIESFLSRLGKRTLAIFVFHSLCTSLMVKFKPFNTWLKSGHLSFKCLIFTILIVLITSAKPFDWFVHKIMTIPKRKTAR